MLRRLFNGREGGKYQQKVLECVKIRRRIRRRASGALNGTRYLDIKWSLASGAEDVEVSTYHRSCLRSASLAACETTCGVQASIIRVQAPPSRQLNRTLSTLCQPVSTSSTVPRDAIFARPLTGILWNCDGEHRKIRKAKFSCVCSANLELTSDDRSRRFYFNEQLQSTFESWTVSQRLRNWLSAYVTVIC